MLPEIFPNPPLTSAATAELELEEALNGVGEDDMGLDWVVGNSVDRDKLW
ncbi:hypothetical protein RIVM261_050040 [Rivularia sp. IAM M-261]|nr:hypothetical protein CAL7716_003260 [Calothrix sp. PCC 7716]GJD20048.1 hypothetical protein RIVM261_050040 [Rivularia sp. IAM M-261]